MGRRFFFLIVCTILWVSSGGCRTTQATSNPGFSTPSLTASAAFKLAPKPVPVATPTVPSPLMIAEKEYLAAYDHYVKMLRESGPQTMETLQALADYQKKYQIYQMLMNGQ